MNESFFLSIFTARKITEEVSGRKLPKNIEYNLNNKKRSLGTTKRYSNNTYLIEISIHAFKKGKTRHDLVNVLIHEMLHVLYFHDGHTGRWKEIANKFNQSNYSKKFGKIERTGKIKRDISDYKYAVKCKKCGDIIGKFKKTDLIKYTDEFYCTICGGDYKRIK